MYVLERIYFEKTLTLKELSEKYHIHPSTLTGIVDRLEGKKLIKRRKAKTDRRSVELVPTSSGNQIVEQHVSEDETFANNLFNTLEEPKKETLETLLEELIENVRHDELFKRN